MKVFHPLEFVGRGSGETQLQMGDFVKGDLSPLIWYE